MTLLELAVRSSLRRRGRAVATICGAALAVLVFVMLRTVLVAWNKGVDFAARDRLATRHKVSIVIPLPRSYVDRIRALPGVEAATYASWAGARWPADPGLFFSSIAVDDDLWRVYREMHVDADSLARWRADEHGAIVGVALAKKLGLHVGDPVTLTGTIYPGAWQYTVDGIYSVARQSGLDQSSFYFHWDYLNERAREGQKDRIGWVITRIDDAANADRIGAAIDDAFRGQGEPTLTMSERAMNQGLLGTASPILAGLHIVSVLTLVILLLVFGGAAAMGARERTTEQGVLCALGFRRAQLRALVLGEALALAAMSGALGLSASYLVVRLGMGRWLEENMGSFFPSVQLTPMTAAGALLLTVALSVAASLGPALRAGRSGAVVALRRAT